MRRSVVVASFMVFLFAIVSPRSAVCCEGPSISLLSPSWGAMIPLGEVTRLKAIVGGWAGLPADGRAVVELKKDGWETFQMVSPAVKPLSTAVSKSGMVVELEWEPSRFLGTSQPGRPNLSVGDYLLRLTLTAAGCSATSAPIPVKISATTLTIVSDAELASVKGISGSGTEESPYLIEGLRLFAGGEQSCLRIAHTRAHFVLRNCVVAGATEAGISLEDVENGWVTQCVVEDNVVGVALGSGTSDVTFCLNTYRRNGADVVGDAARCGWDDGHVGNYWDTYSGRDDGGDGVGETAHAVEVQYGSAYDNHPLVEPYVGAEDAPPPDKVRIEMALQPGESFVMELKMESRLEMQLVGETVTSEAESTTRWRSDVVGTGVHNMWRVQATLTEDTGVATANGEPFPYPGAEVGTVIEWSVHRFGAQSVDFLGSQGGSPTPVSVAFPVRWIGEGDEWRVDLGLDAAALEIPSGEVACDATYRLVAVEEREGRRYAVIAGQVSVRVEGTENVAPLGEISVVAIAAMSFTASIDVATGNSADGEGTLALTVSQSFSGVTVMKMESTSSFEFTQKPA